MAGELFYIDPDAITSVSNEMLRSLDEIANLKSAISYEIQSVFDRLVPIEEIRGLFSQGQESFYGFNSLATQLEEARIGAFRLQMVADLARSNMDMLRTQAETQVGNAEAKVNAFLDWVWNTADTAINEGEMTLNSVEDFVITEGNTLATDVLNAGEEAATMLEVTAIEAVTIAEDAVLFLETELTEVAQEVSDAVISDFIRVDQAIDATVSMEMAALEREEVVLERDIENAFTVPTAKNVGKSTTDTIANKKSLNEVTAVDIYKEIRLQDKQGHQITIRMIGNNQMLVTVAGLGLGLADGPTDVNDAGAGLYNPFNPYTLEVQSAIEQYIKDNHLINTNPQVTIAGHSIGGIVGEYLAGQQNGYDVTHVITYGSPDVVLPVPGVRYDQYSDKLDPVPYLGIDNTVINNNRWSFLPNVHDHSVNYLPTNLQSLPSIHTEAYRHINDATPILQDGSLSSSPGPVWYYHDTTQNGTGVGLSDLYLSNLALDALLH